MAKNGLQKIWIRVLLTVMVAAMMTLIFFFSMEPAEKSDRTSGKISMTVICALHPDYETYPEAKKESLYDDVQHTVRKAAHFTEYLILGLLMKLCLESWFGKRGHLNATAWAACTLYACTDEIHQLIIDGRSGQITDVLIDSCGALAGILLIVFLYRIQLQKGKKHTCP